MVLRLERDLDREAELASLWAITVEHKGVDQLIATLGTRKMPTKKREANFTVLIEYVRHHVKEEEQEMFPKVRKLRGLDLANLAERMLNRRIALHKKMRMPPF